MQPVKFTVAGSEWTAEEGKFYGTFHPIPKELWDAIVGFHRQIAIDHKAESLTYHKWCEAEQRYHTLIPHQKTKKNGLSVDVDWKDPRNIILLDAYAEKYKEEFLPACTIHTHVNIAAFESGTDAADERETPGWHITLGHLLTHKEYDTHFRMRVPKTKSLKVMIDVTRMFKLEWNNLFSPEEDMEKWIETTPGTTDFYKFLDRVHAS